MMNDDRNRSEDYQQALDPYYARRKLLYRAAAATAGLVVLMLLLMWLDSGSEESASVHELAAAPDAGGAPAGSGLTLPAPSRSAPPPREQPPASFTPPATVVVPAPVAEPAPVVEAGSAAASDPVTSEVVTPPPPAAAQATSPVASPVAVAPAAVAPAPAKPAPAPRTTARTTPPAAAPAAQDGKSYRVQLKDYVPLSELSSQKQKLAQGGVAAEEQRRLVVTGYTSRAAADQAVARLKRDHRLSGFVIADKNAFMVQVGVFSDAANAEKLARTLKNAGYAVQTQGRLIVGPYPSQAAAQQALVSLRQNHRLEGSVLPPK